MKAKLPDGTIVDHPKAFRLVASQAAEPYDEECRDECFIRGITKPEAAPMPSMGDVEESEEGEL